MSSSELSPGAVDTARSNPQGSPDRDDQPVLSELVFPSMGSTAQVLVVLEPGAPQSTADELATMARRRLEQIESRWSRFRPSSELNALNRAEGLTLSVSEDTFELVQRCVHAWRATGGRCDPSVHASMLRLGYDRSIERLAATTATQATANPSTSASPGCADIHIDPARRTVRFGPGVALDPGGIGKGLAADLVVAELRQAGAAGALVNLGGDTVVAGRPPQRTGWQVGVADPHAGTEDATALCAVLGLSVGAVATSSRLERRWAHHGRPWHHLLDPATGYPADHGIDAITVMASTGWWAEALAKAAFVAGPEQARKLMSGAGATGLMVHADGQVEPFDGLETYLR